MDRSRPSRATCEIAIYADHNHHGPDTAFDVNHEWYDLMIDQAADADRRGGRRVAAGPPRGRRRPITGSASATRRDPQVLDPTLGVLRATATNGDTIATMIFWANHPEITLFWRRRTPRSPTTAGARPQVRLHFEDRYFTADFPGWATRIVEDELGGEALYFNGAIGGLVTPLGATVWEVDEDARSASVSCRRRCAEPPLGADDFTERNFRRAYLIGRELATAALDARSIRRHR